MFGGVDTRISLYKLDVFCRVVECGTVTGAAEQLAVAQPVVSEHVRSLERRLDAKLFRRSGRVLELTESGRVAYEWARDVVRRTREAEVQMDRIGRAARNTITVAACTASAATILPDVLLRFQAAHPEAVVHLNHLASDQAVRAVRTGACDFGLVSYADESIGDPRDAPELEVEWVYEEDLVPVCAPNHVAARGRTSIARLVGLPFVCTPHGSARRRSIDRQFQRAGAGTRNVVMELGHSGPITDAVEQGIGVALLSRHAVAAKLALGELSEIAMPDDRFVVRFAVLRRRDRVLTALQTTLLEDVRRHLADGASPAPHA
jgi:DNA-binding transcriptional LysR family regulator